MYKWAAVFSLFPSGLTKASVTDLRGSDVDRLQFGDGRVALDGVR